MLYTAQNDFFFQIGNNLSFVDVKLIIYILNYILCRLPTKRSLSRSQTGVINRPCHSGSSTILLASECGFIVELDVP